MAEPRSTAPAHSLARLSARVFNVSLLLAPSAAETIGAFFLGEQTETELAPRTRAGAFDGGGEGDDGPGYSFDNGVATIVVHGELVNRGSWLNSISGLTSYEALRATLGRARDDPRVKGIVLDFDSPGGEAAGAMETADAVRALDAVKPVVAYINSLAASAAYAIAAGARTIVTTPSGYVGSIGVVYLHLDRSGAYAARGVKPTLIHAGAYKVDGHPFAGLEPQARARIQSTVDGVYDLFTASVGKHRPALGAAGARKTEAGLYMGERAVRAGLADRVGTLATARQLAAGGAPSPLRASTEKEGPPMAVAAVHTSLTPPIADVSATLPAQFRPPGAHEDPLHDHVKAARAAADSMRAKGGRGTPEEIEALWAPAIAVVNATLPARFRPSGAHEHTLRDQVKAARAAADSMRAKGGRGTPEEIEAFWAPAIAAVNATLPAWFRPPGAHEHTLRDQVKTARAAADSIRAKGGRGTPEVEAFWAPAIAAVNATLPAQFRPPGAHEQQPLRDLVTAARAAAANMRAKGGRGTPEEIEAFWAPAIAAVNATLPARFRPPSADEQQPLRDQVKAARAAADNMRAKGGRGTAEEIEAFWAPAIAAVNATLPARRARN